jgi:hypothetical protein
MTRPKTDESSPTLKAALSLLYRIKEALDTEEAGDALVEVARNAHRAEMAYAVHLTKQRTTDVPDLQRIADAFEKLTKPDEHGYMELELMMMRAIKAGLHEYGPT